MYKIYTRKSGMPKGYIHKILLIMRLTTVILVTAIMQLSASTYGQKITLNEKNASLMQIFKQIRSQSGYDFLFDRDLIEKADPVSIRINNATIQEVLKRCFESQSLIYNIEDKTIVIREKTIMDKISGLFSYVDVFGTVTDERGQPLSGVSVFVKGSSKATITNNKGVFAFRVPEDDAILVFSYIGYKTKEVSVAAQMNVSLEPDPAKLDEVMVIGYGTTTKRTSTGDVVKITALDLEKQPVTNVLQALSGQLPGVFVTQSNGLPGAGITVQVRGVNSLTKGNLPLYIIDGVPYLSSPINTMSKGNTLPSAEGSTSAMNSINPGDVESIEVLKDADATAIYGSRAANGVVLITTKKGKSGKTKFGFTINRGISNVSHFVDELSTADYLNMRKQAFVNNGVTPTAVNAPDLTLWDQNGYTNFQKLLLDNTANTTDASVNLSGGDSRTNFYMSGTYHKEDNVFLGNQGYRRASANVSLNHSSLDQRFTLGFSAIYSADKNNISTTDLATYAYNLPPNFPLYNPDGSLYWYSPTGTNNPLGYLNQTNDNKTTNLLTSLNLKYNILPGLDVKTTLGFSHTDMDQTTIRPLTSMDMSVATNMASSNFVYNVTNNYIIEPQLTYKRKIWKGTLDALVGGTWQSQESKQPYYVSARGFASDEFLTNISSATTVSTSSASQNYKYASLFSRVTYNIENKYIANLTYRRDGSSRFGPNNRFGNFGSAGAAWIFSEENLIKDNLPWLSFGKLRGSYGIVGSDDITNYAYLNTYSSSSTVYNGSTSLTPTRIANDDFKWEETKKLEGAIDLGFFKDRLLLSASVYRNRTSNQLLNYTISPQTGFTSFQSNLPATVQNSGIELTLTSTNINVRDFKWTTSLNFTTNKNKVQAFPDIEKSTYYTTYIVGNPVSSIYLYNYTGISETTGLPTFTDFNNSGTITTGLAAIGRGDKVYAGTTYPKFYGGVTNTLTYKRLTLDFTFQYVKQKGRSILTSTFYPPGYMYNGSSEALNGYLALGDITKLATQTTRTVTGLAAYQAYSNYIGSDASYVDASFIRLKNVNLSYALPSAWMTRVGVSNLRVYVQGQNLFTITNYLGFDPESQSVATPPLRTITSGIQCTF